MKKGAIYVRKSRLTDKGESIKNQIEICTQYAQENNIHVDKLNIYYDEGFSGKNTKRPEFKRMINDLKSKKFNVLICYRLDRISRSLRDFSNVIDLLEKYNVSFVSICEQFDTNTPMGKAMMYISGVFAQLERETISQRIKDNMIQLSKTGRWLGGTPPTGFSSKPITYIDSNMNEKKMYILSPLKDELNIVKLIFKIYIEFNSLSKVESYCLDHNIKSKNNLTFSSSSIREILSNPVYCIADQDLYRYITKLGSKVINEKKDFNGKYGVLVYNRHSNKLDGNDKKNWIVSLSKHKGIISSKDWINVQSILNNNKEKPSRLGTSNVALLSGLIICNKCKSVMRVKYGKSSNKGKKNYYYVCTLKERSRGVKCSNSSINGSFIDKLIFDTLHNHFKDANYIQNNIDTTLKLENNLFPEMESRKITQKKIYNYKRKINILKSQLENNINSSASKYMKIKVMQMENTISKLNNKLNNIDTNYIIDIQNSNSNINYNLKIYNDINYSDLPFNIKKHLLFKVVDNVLWENDNVEIVLKEYQ
ncbi:resolvase domain-containing protein [Gottschalkia purinilytica]|uniref:Resolvase domain-containing protein n=1 Tax=Gottschalkia purinilytica TaxID=1503 RepID=A0A0L0WEK7_GOTPU|nr:recombinase family protein [Gottschalkia purinilytica]KNF09871.1 resolvase domain-containing protein [Gottschalkia purinilytica]